MDTTPTRALRRKIVLDCVPGQVRAALEDDYHHFSVVLSHDATRVTGIEQQHLRTPWSLCAHAGAGLQQLLGSVLASDPLVAPAHIDAQLQCTHQLDLARLAMAHAGRGGRREYLLEVRDAVDGVRSASALRNGAVCLRWDVHGTAIGTEGLDLRRFDARRWSDADPELAEAMLVLRRAVLIAGGRGVDFSVVDDMAPFAARMAGACYAFQPVRLALARRERDSMRDFSDHPEQLLPGW